MDIERMKDLIRQRDAIDAELGLNGEKERKERKPLTCGRCGSTEHTARTCKEKANGTTVA